MGERHVGAHSHQCCRQQSGRNEARSRTKKSPSLLEKLDPKATRIVLDETGKLLSSLEFADLIRKSVTLALAKSSLLLAAPMVCTPM